MLYVFVFLLILFFLLAIFIYKLNKKIKNKNQEIFAFLDAFPDYIVVHDELNIYYSSPKIEKIIGKKIKTINEYIELFPVEIRAEIMNNILKEKEGIYETVFRQYKDKIYRIYSAPIYIDNKNYTLNVFSDITKEIKRDKNIKLFNEINNILEKILKLTYDEHFNLKGVMEIIYNYLNKINLIDMFAYSYLINDNESKVMLYYENKLYNYIRKRNEKSIIWYFLDNKLEKLYIPNISNFQINDYKAMFKEIKDKNITSYIFPYHFNGKISGVFSFSKNGEDAFSEEEKRVIELVAREIDFIIRYQNILRKYKEEKEYYESLAHKDILTNLYSRYFFNEWIIKHVEYLKRSNKNSIIVMIDINKFKKINDIYGHVKGDEVLRFISNTIQYNIRKMDIAVRFGGDEFLIVFPEASFEDIKNKMLNISQKIQRNNFDFDISVSYGISELDVNNYIESLKIADEEMYKMKEKLNKNIENM
ncbi:hypothetical protein JCM30566_07000 [Marinitoga arctica]